MVPANLKNPIIGTKRIPDLKLLHQMSALGLARFGISSFNYEEGDACGIVDLKIIVTNGDSIKGSALNCTSSLAIPSNLKQI